MSEHNDFRDKLENVIPDNMPALPVGTLAEIEKEGLDPRAVPCCHKRVNVNGAVEVLGCSKAEKCLLKAQGVSGPHFYGIQYLKGKVHGGAMVRGIRDCFYIADFKDNIETPENGGSLKIVAREGESFKMVVAGPETNYKDKMVEVTVPFFPRPGENPDLVKEQLKAEIRAEEKRRAVEAQHDRNIAIVTSGSKPKPKP